MGHRVSQWAPHMAAGHALRLTMLVAAHDYCAPPRPPLAWEAQEPTRHMLQHTARRHETVWGVPACSPTCARAMGGPSGAWTPHAPSLSSSHEWGMAGPEKGALAFLHDAEATTYRMLPQVLQNRLDLCVLPMSAVLCQPRYRPKTGSSLSWCLISRVMLRDVLAAS
jgi:hypothetical protein